MHQTVVCVCIFMTALFLSGDAAKCCFPPTYEGYQDIVRFNMKNGVSSFITGTIHYWHDNVSRRSAFKETLMVNGVKTEITLINDYNVTNTKYILTDRGCSKKSLVGDYPYGCIADSAQEEKHKYYGKHGCTNTMGVRTFDMSTGPKNYYKLNVDQSNCFLLSQTHVDPDVAGPSFEHVEYYNFTVGISDYSVFDIPKQCQIPIVGK